MSDKKQKETLTHKTSVGGQALIEGIMMQGPKGAAISVRVPDGTIDTEIKQVKHVKDKNTRLADFKRSGCLCRVDDFRLSMPDAFRGKKRNGGHGSG